MIKREKFLAMHPYTISQYRDGKWGTYLPDKTRPNNRKYIGRKTLEEVQQIVIDYWEKESDNPTIKEVFDEWNDRRLKLGKISNSTHTRNRQEFNRHYADFGNKKIKAIASYEIEDFLEEEIAKFDLTAKAFSNLKTLTKGFLLRAKKQGYISFNVSELFDDMDISDRCFRKVIKEDYQEVFNEEETELMMNYLIENFDIWNAGIILLFLTGIRIGELVALKPTDFEGDNIIKIRRTKTRYRDDSGKEIYAVKDFPKSKAGVRTVVIPGDYIPLVKKIRLLNPFGEYLFMNKGKRITTNSFRNRERRICKKLGIPHKSPHKIRKTYGTILLDNNVDKKLVTELMGHSNIAITENHYHRNRRSLDEKARIISEIPDFTVKAQ